MKQPPAFDLLVVDDDAEFRDALRSRFAKQGFEVQTAANGQEALALAARRNFDVANQSRERGTNMASSTFRQNAVERPTKRHCDGGFCEWQATAIVPFPAWVTAQPVTESLALRP